MSREEAMQPKFCINCKHIARNGAGDASRYRCMAPQNVLGRKNDLVTGVVQIIYERESCYEARLNYGLTSCGTAGQWFEEKPAEIVQPSPQWKQPPARLGAADLLSQLDAMK